MATYIFNVNDAFAPRIVAACRGLFPTQTAGLMDNGAVKTVLITYIASLVSQWEADNAAGSSDSVQAQVQQLWNARLAKYNQQAAQSQTDTANNVS